MPNVTLCQVCHAPPGGCDCMTRRAIGRTYRVELEARARDDRRAQERLTAITNAVRAQRRTTQPLLSRREADM